MKEASDEQKQTVSSPIEPAVMLLIGGMLCFYLGVK